MSSCWDSSKKEITSLDNGRFQPIDTQNRSGGTHGDVILCEDTIRNSRVAVKKISNDYPEQGIAIHGLREIAAYKRLNQHTHILNFHMVISDANKYYIVFEAMDMSLKSFIRQTSIDDNTKLHIKKNIANGLAYCHHIGIMHRDIKPENILTISKGNTTMAKLCDFGLAKVNTRNPSRCHSIEAVTLWYKAPELLLGNRNYNEKIDIWALGCVFWELDFGKVPFRGDCEFDTLRKIYKLCGTPNEDNFPGVSSLPYYNKDIQFSYKTKDLPHPMYTKLFDFNHKERPAASKVLMYLCT